MSGNPTPAALADRARPVVAPRTTVQPQTYKVWYEGDHQQARNAIVTADRIDRGDQYVELWSGEVLMFVVPTYRLYTIVRVEHGA